MTFTEYLLQEICLAKIQQKELEPDSLNQTFEVVTKALIVSKAAVPQWELPPELPPAAATRSQTNKHDRCIRDTAKAWLEDLSPGTLEKLLGCVVAAGLRPRTI